MRRHPNPNSEENIRRIDTKSRAKKQTHGFQVHFLRGTKVVTKMFSDSIHGGKEAARRAARESRREILRSCRGPAIHDRRGDKSTAFEFTAVGPNIAVELSSIKPDKLLAG